MASIDSVPVSGSVVLSPAQWDGDCAVVWLRGEHDISTVDALSEIIFRSIGLDDANLILDLSEVLFMDAATVGVIIRTREFLRLRSRSLVLRSPSRRARFLLDLCGLSNLLGPRSTAASTTGGAGALGSWVAVPTTDRVDDRADPFELNPSSTPTPGRANHISADREASREVASHRADDRTTIRVNCGSP
ncbi:MAG: hypothetical protein JWO62_3274 [Acidimicrobiaceae bacterium]|jgi:anti-anti-sigma factor|nr:hypothetical protein [Acidimicrobiaceae bacterium]